MADYVVLNDKTSGVVLQMWLRTTSDNIATCFADGKLTVDGGDVVLGLGDTADICVTLMTNPAGVDVDAPSGCFVVDDPAAPGDTATIATVGERDQYYNNEDDAYDGHFVSP